MALPQSPAGFVSPILRPTSRLPLHSSPLSLAHFSQLSLVLVDHVLPIIDRAEVVSPYTGLKHRRVHVLATN